MKILFTTVFILFMGNLFAQNAILKGTITSNGNPIQGVNVIIQNQYRKTGVSSSKSGNYEINLPEGTYQIIISGLALQTISDQVTLIANQTEIRNYTMKEDILGLDQVVVTGTNQSIPHFIAPIVVSKISGKVFETTQSLSLSEGLRFTPGLRTETNCQNCGFNQLRINGLQGTYSQILINGRAVFSSLAGVYGLEMIPANMIDRIEVVRGSGSAIYGGNAIGGTVNILTKDPIDNTFSIGNNLSLYKGETPDNTLFTNASVVSDKLDKGMNIFAYQRNRAPFDANQDEYSEITKLKNTTFGADAFWNISDRNKIKFNLNSIQEFRRGGNKFDLLAHESDITEQLEHRIIGGDLSFEHLSADFSHKLSYYVSAQHTNRNSFYGGGLGKSIDQDQFDSLSNEDKETFFGALASYGKSEGLVGVGGVQYNYAINPQWNLSLGTEYKYDKVDDQANGHGRSINQNVKTYGNYAQLEWKPTDALTFLAGTRYDYIDIKGTYTYRTIAQNADKTLSKFVPRFTAMYALGDNWKLRATYAQGYRAPQAFDEDLHTDVLEGNVIFVELDKDLKPEYSDSFTASVNYTQKEGNTQTNIILEGFYTQIKDAFFDEKQNISSSDNIIRKLKKNATDNLGVLGINAEVNFAFGNKIIWQTGITIQSSQYSEPQSLWTNEDDPNDKREVLSKYVMKTPDIYGFTNFTYTPISNVSLSYSGIFTGQMYVPHVVEESGFQVITKSPSFYEQNIRGAYNFNLKNNSKIELSIGVQNIFNNYQKDFDSGKSRDADYIYGPQRPRTYFMGITYKLN